MAGKKFRFSLDSVLKLRAHETEIAREAMGWAVRKRQEQELEVQKARQRLQELAKKRLYGAIDSMALRHHDAFRRDAQKIIEEAKQELLQAIQNEENARQIVVKKRREEESLQKLYEKEEMAHRKEMETAENQFLDEQAITSYCRQKLQTRT